METGEILNWTLQNEIPIPKDAGQLLIQGEQPVAAFRTYRDSAIFTNKRLICQRPRETERRRPRS